MKRLFTAGLLILALNASIVFAQSAQIPGKPQLTRPVNGGARATSNGTSGGMITKSPVKKQQRRQRKHSKKC
jgi:hypothetical protein